MKSLIVTLFVLTLIGPALAADQPMTVDKEKKTITIAAKVAPRKLPTLDQVYPIEVIAAWGHDRQPVKGQKSHETIVTYDVLPSEIHKALEGLGLKPGKPAFGQDSAAEGPEVKISLEIPGEAGGEAKRVPIEKCLVDKRTGKTMPALKWHFTGSVQKQPDPDKPDKVYGADTSGTLISIFPVTNETVFQSSLTMKDEPLLKMETNKKVLPAEGTAVKLIIEVK